jgi:hypothetical protein
MLRSKEREELFSYVQGIGAEKPRPDQVDATDGATLLRDVRSFIRRYVVVSEAQASAIALWIMHTHAISVRCHALLVYQFCRETVWEDKIIGSP